MTASTQDSTSRHYCDISDSRVLCHHLHCVTTIQIRSSHHNKHTTLKATMTGTNGTNGNGSSAPRVGTDTVKMGLAQMLKGGVIVSFCTFAAKNRQ